MSTQNQKNEHTTLYMQYTVIKILIILILRINTQHQ